jgi:hypothetical protein
MVIKTALVFLGLVFTSCCHAADSSPEAAEMFERLVTRIPVNVDAHEVHEYVGKEFTYMYGDGNSMNQGVYMVPFIVSNRLYCVHITDSKPRVIDVYRILNTDPDRLPVSRIGQRVLEQRKERPPKPAFSQVVDLHAAIDHNEVISEADLKYTLVYSSASKVTNPEK